MATTATHGKSAYKPADVSPQRRARSRYTLRLWAVRHAYFLKRVYVLIAEVFLKLNPVCCAAANRGGKNRDRTMRSW